MHPFATLAKKVPPHLHFAFSKESAISENIQSSIVSLLFYYILFICFCFWFLANYVCVYSDVKKTGKK
jgi:hypothetical protein